MGLVLLRKHTEEQIEHFRAHPPEWCTSGLERDLHLQIAMGCEALEIIPPSLRYAWDDFLALNEFAEDWEQRYGPDPKVRIVTDWIFDALAGTGISYKELAVVTAVYSKIGLEQGPVLITREEIWRRSLAYKSEQVLKEETGGSGFSWTTRQIRSTIEELDARNFYARVTFGRRKTYYSNRLSRKELAEQVFVAKVYRPRKRQARIDANAELTRRIQAERRKRAGGDATEGATGTPP